MTKNCIPVVVTGGPRQNVRERSQKESQRPRYDHIIIEIYVERDQHHRIAYACEVKKQDLQIGNEP